MDHNQFRKDFDTVARGFFCLLILLSSLFVIFFRSTSTQSQTNIAAGFVGAIFTYYISP
jgi:hypothetical protein